MSDALLNAIHPLLSDRTRLLIMAKIASLNEPISFKELLNDLKLSKGNLSSHMRKLEDADMLSVEKTFINRKPLTTYTCTKKGRQSIKEYLSSVEKMLKMIDK